MFVILVTGYVHIIIALMHIKIHNKLVSKQVVMLLQTRSFDYICRYFMSSNTTNAGQTMALRMPSRPSQKLVAVVR